MPSYAYAATESCKHYPYYHGSRLQCGVQKQRHASLRLGWLLWRRPAASTDGLKSHSPRVRRKRQRLSSNDPIETAPTTRPVHPRNFSFRGSPDRDLTFVGTKGGSQFFSAATNGGDDRNLSSRRDKACESARISGILVSNENIDVFADLSLLRRDAIANTRIEGAECRQGFG